jgi:serine/threonine-protein kinase
MEKALWNKIEAIVDEALTLSGWEREKYIAEQCTNDAVLFEHVTQLLNEIKEADENSFLEFKSDNFRKIANSQQFKKVDYVKGDKIGPYQVEAIIASGGMGSVYKAKRADGAYEMEVAIKFIKTQNYSRETLRRFELERKILAKLQHPNIARLIDGGLTKKDGAPYIIMEYVNGTPINEYCIKYGCSIEDRIKLFKQVLHAVGFAHENLVIHRDLKPGNIFVDDSGKVKILDFGISKLLEEEDEITGIHTQTGVRLLTTRYAAPEQIRQENITTATDLYSLGVVFYELLSGINPFDLENASRYQIEQAVIHQEPVKPSQKTIDNTIKKKLEGDLDAIALKAIRKEPDRRYRVANEFLEDISDYENGLPVSAREGSMKYRTQKFLGRHKQGVVITLGIILLISGFIGFYTQQITEERNLAQVEANKAEEISGFLVGLFEANKPEYSKGDTLTAQKLLETGKTEINKLNNQPAVKARMLEVVGNIYNLLAQPQEADSMLQASLNIKKNLYEPSDVELATNYYLLATVKNSLGQYDEAEELLDTAITYQKQITGQQSMEVAESLRLLAASLRENGKIDSAYTTINKADMIFKSLGDTTSKEYLGVLMQMGLVNQAAGYMEKAEKNWRRSLKRSQELYESPHPVISRNMDGLAFVLKETQKFEEAESLYLKSLNMDKIIYGNKHLNTASTINNLAGLYFYTKDYNKADKYFTESYAIHKEILGELHPSTITILYNLTAIKGEIGDFESAENNFKKIIELDISTFGENHPNVATDYSGLASLYNKQKKYQLALQFYNKSTNIRRIVYENPRHHFIGFNLNSMGEIHAELGNYEMAEELYFEALVCLIDTYETDHKRIRDLIDNYARLMELQNNDFSQDSLIFKAQQLVEM